LPCHSSRHVENLPEMSCCLQKWDSAITSTRCVSIPCPEECKAWLVHSWGCITWNSSAKIPPLRTSPCSILWIMWTHTLVIHGGIPSQVDWQWSHSALQTLAWYHIFSGFRSTLSWIYLHFVACCMWHILVQILQTI
jgi:hypothetical protein